MALWAAQVYQCQRAAAALELTVALWQHGCGRVCFVLCVVCCVWCVLCVVCVCVCGCVCLCVCVVCVFVFVFCSALFYVVRVEAVDVRGWSPMHR